MKYVLAWDSGGNVYAFTANEFYNLEVDDLEMYETFAEVDEGILAKVYVSDLIEEIKDDAAEERRHQRLESLPSIFH